MDNILEMTKQEIWDLFESENFRIGDLDYLIKNGLVEQCEDNTEDYIDTISGITLDEDIIEKLQNYYNNSEHTFVESIIEIDMGDKSFDVSIDGNRFWYPLSLIIPMDCHIGLIHLDIPDEEMFLL